MGGIKVDENSKTSMDCLYAAGETSCNGVHGRNRLASNSLLESLVFAQRCARHITEVFDLYQPVTPDICLDDFKDYDKDYIQTVKDEIERIKNK